MSVKKFFHLDREVSQRYEKAKPTVLIKFRRLLGGERTFQVRRGRTIGLTIHEEKQQLLGRPQLQTQIVVLKDTESQSAAKAAISKIIHP